MEGAKYTMTEKGKGKTYAPKDGPQTPTSRELSSPSHSGSIPSPPTSPLQGARLPMNRRFPVRPTSASPLGSSADSAVSSTRSAGPLQAYTPSGQPPKVAFGSQLGPSQVDRTVGSTESIAESMIKGFEYDPNDRTPPKRRMKAVAEAVKSADNGSHTSASSLYEVCPGRQRAQQKPDQPMKPLSLECSESSRASSASCALTSITTLSDVEAKLADNQAALQEAYDSVNVVSDQSTLATDDLTFVDETDEEDWDTGPAASFFKSDAQKRFEERQRLTILSEETEETDSCGDDHGSQSEPPSKFVLDHSNISAWNIVEPGAGSSQHASRSGDCTPTSSSQNSFVDGDGIQDAASRAVAVSVPTADLNSSPVAKGTIPDQRPHALTTLPVQSVTREKSSSDVGLSPIREVESSGESSATSSHGPPSIPMRTENEKPPSLSPSALSPPSVRSLSSNRISECCWVALYVLAWLTPLAFLGAAFSNLATTTTFDRMPPGLFTAGSETLHSDDCSASLTMNRTNDHTLRFNVSAMMNITSKPTEVMSNHWTFLFDWTVDGGMRHANGTQEGTRLSAMPVPAFKVELIRSMGFLGLFAVIFWVVSFLSKLISRVWHCREDGNVYWTRSLLRWFDAGRIWIEVIVAAVCSALIWAAASRALLSASF